MEEEMMADYDDDDQDILHIDDITKLYGQNIVGKILSLDMILDNPIPCSVYYYYNFFRAKQRNQTIS